MTESDVRQATGEYDEVMDQQRKGVRPAASEEEEDDDDGEDHDEERPPRADRHRWGSLCG